MQERYCDCGASVLVSFVPTPGDWQALFWEHQAASDRKTDICPGCGRPLHIHALR